MSKVRVAIVTGGHSYDVPAFHVLFNTMDGVQPVIQHMDDFASSSEEVRDSYDVVLFYSMMMDGPTDEGLEWYAGTPKTALERLGQTSQGICVLHHALVAYPEWGAWAELIGIEDRSFGYHFDQHIHVVVADAAHPITRGLSAWDMPDETYTMPDAGAESHVLLTTNHPKSLHTIAWTRQYRNSPVFCFQSGHDSRTWADAQFRTVLERGLLWCAGRV